MSDYPNQSSENLPLFDTGQTEAETRAAAVKETKPKRKICSVVALEALRQAGSAGLTREAMLKALNMMPVPPTLIVNSDGVDGGFHAYWILEEPYRIDDEDDRQYIAELSKRWESRLNEICNGKLDSTGDLTRFLRVVGQPRSNGNLVTCHEYHDDRFYSLRQLTIPKSQAELKQAAKREATSVIRETLGPITESDLPITGYIDASNLTVESLLAEAGYTEMKPGEWLRPGSQSGARTLKLSTKITRPGINVLSAGDPNFPVTKLGQFCSIDEVFVNLRHGKDWKSAASWCKEQIDRQRCDGVDLSGINEQTRRSV